jgi:hypothetical protein
MSDGEVGAAKAAFTQRAGVQRKNMSDKDYREFRTHPLLMLHLLKLEYPKSGGPGDETTQNVVAWGISFPGTSVEDTEVEYVVNTRWWNENFGDDLEEYAEEDVDAA